MPTDPSTELNIRPPEAHRSIRRGLLYAGLTTAVIGLGILGLLRTDLGAQAIEELIQEARPAPLFLSWVLMNGGLLFAGFRWRSLLDGRAPALGLASILCAGFLISYSLPGPVGDLGSMWFTHRRYRVPLPTSLTTGVAARVIGVMTAAFLAAGVGLAFDLPVPEGFERLVWVAAASSAIGGSLLLWLAARPHRWRAMSRQFAERLEGRPRLGKLAKRMDSAIGGMAEAMAEVATHPGRLVRAAGWTVVGHLSVSVGMWVAAWSLGSDPSAAGLVFTYALTVLGAVFLFALPARQLAWDGMLALLLTTTGGLDATDAIAVTVFVRLQRISLVVLGAAALAWLARQVDPAPEELP